MNDKHREASGVDAAEGGLTHAVRRKGSFLGTMKAVAWSFIGIRKRSGYDEDVQKLNPVHVIIAGILGGVIFVISLVVLVNWIVGSGVAAS